MAPRDKDHELLLAKQRIRVLELEVQILDRRLELVNLEKRLYPYVTYGTVTTAGGVTGWLSGSSTPRRTSSP